MLISGGKVIAIDKVKHDNTLSGDGRFDSLGVNTEKLLTKAEASAAFQEKGDYVSINTLSSYYKKYEVDNKFALSADVYGKTYIDTQFQNIQNTYATKTEVTSVSSWVENTYMPSAQITANYATKDYVTAASAHAYYTLQHDIEQELVPVFDHIANTDIHLTPEQAAVLASLSSLDVSKLVTVSSMPNPSTGVYGVKYDRETGQWWWSEMEGGGGGGYPIAAENGLTGSFDGQGVMHLGIDGYSTLTSFSADITYSAEIWNSFDESKQDKLSDAQIEAINSISAAYTLVGASGIKIEESTATSSTIISFTGRQGNVELVEGEPQSPEQGIIYMVVGEK